MESLLKERANCKLRTAVSEYLESERIACCLLSVYGSAGFQRSYLYVEWNADEDIPTYGDDDSQEIGLWEQTVNRHILGDALLVTQQL